MKITRKQLRQIIKEEVSLLSETEMTQEKLNKVLDHLENARDHVRSKDFFKADPYTNEPIILNKLQLTNLSKLNI